MAKLKTIAITLDETNKGFNVWVGSDVVITFSKRGHNKAYEQIHILKKSFKAIKVKTVVHDLTKREPPSWWTNWAGVSF